MFHLKLRCSAATALLRRHLPFTIKSQEGARLDDVMSRQIICVTQNIGLDALSNTFKKVSGVCVVDEEKRLIGIVSRKDLSREGVSCYWGEPAWQPGHCWHHFLECSFQE